MFLAFSRFEGAIRKAKNKFLSFARKVTDGVIIADASNDCADRFKVTWIFAPADKRTKLFAKDPSEEFMARKTGKGSTIGQHTDKG